MNCSSPGDSRREFMGVYVRYYKYRKTAYRGIGAIASLARLPAKLVTAKCTTVPVWSSRSDSGARRAARCARSRRRRQRPRPRHLSIPMGRYMYATGASAPISARESKCARQGVIWAQRPSFGTPLPGHAPAWARPCLGVRCFFIDDGIAGPIRLLKFAFGMKASPARLWCWRRARHKARRPEGLPNWGRASRVQPWAAAMGSSSGRPARCN